MRGKWFKLDVLKTLVCLTVDRQKRGINNTAETVNGEEEGSKSSNMASILVSTEANMKAWLISILSLILLVYGHFCCTFLIVPGKSLFWVYPRLLEPILAVSRGDFEGYGGLGLMRTVGH